MRSAFPLSAAIGEFLEVIQPHLPQRHYPFIPRQFPNAVDGGILFHLAMVRMNADRAANAVRQPPAVRTSKLNGSVRVGGINANGHHPRHTGRFRARQNAVKLAFQSQIRQMAVGVDHKIQ